MIYEDSFKISQGRHSLRELDHSPGPIYLPFIKPFGNGISIKSRTKERLTNDGPGPAAYMVVPMKGCNLGISLRQRFKDSFSSISPGSIKTLIKKTLVISK